VLYCSYFVFFLLKFLLSPKYPSLLPCPFLCKSHFFLVLFITEIPPKSSSSSSRKSKIQEIFRQLPKHTKPTSVLLLPQIKKLNRSNDQSNPFSNNQKSQMGSQIFPHFPTLSLNFSHFLLLSLLLSTTTDKRSSIPDDLDGHGMSCS
jgi:hypothetical protein